MVLKDLDSSLGLMFSVIIPTYNDWPRLQKCLAALEEQDISPGFFEVIVVNNNPLDGMPPEFVLPGNATIYEESKPGSYCARNKAISVARGNILAFTDSDCIPERTWLSKAYECFSRNTDVALVAGDIKLFFRGSRLTNAELFEKVYAFRQARAVAKGVSVTANLLVKKTVFDDIGFFDENLKSGGDYDWTRRATSRGYVMRFNNEVVVFHPARHTIQALVKKEKRVAGWIGRRPLLAFRRLLKYMIPPVNTLFHGEEISFADRAKVFVVRYYLNVVRTIEEIKISLGKKPNRE